MKTLPLALTISLSVLIVSGCGLQQASHVNQGEVIVSDADFPCYESAAKMYSRATTVVVGEVTEARVDIHNLAMEGDVKDESLNPQAGEIVGETASAEEVFTIYTLEAHDIIKRDATFESEGPIEVKMYGGEVDGVVYKLADAPDLGDAKGKLLVLFLEEYGKEMPASQLNNDQAILVVDSDYSQVQSLVSNGPSETFMREVLGLISSK